MPDEQSSLRASGSRDNGVHSAGRVIASPPRDDQLGLLGKGVWKRPEGVVPLADSFAEWDLLRWRELILMSAFSPPKITAQRTSPGVGIAQAAVINRNRLTCGP